MLANLSQLAWGHILFGGNYSFNDQAILTDLSEILEDIGPLSEEYDDIT